MATNGRVIPRLKERYESEILPVLREEFGYPNVMAVPRPEKIALNIGIGEAIQNSKALDAASRDLAIITGQRPAVRRAKKSVAAFKLRAGMPVGLTVTLRGDRMYEFLDRLLNLALPRVRDFRGLSTRSFDGRGNYTLGLREQLIFPEIEYDRIDRVRGLEVTIVTSARTDTEARRLLELMGMPFQRAQVGAGAAS
jgi:large subunit ribosomal protein L5